jgi:hypothetical protein
MDVRLRAPEASSVTAERLLVAITMLIGRNFMAWQRRLAH